MKPRFLVILDTMWGTVGRAPRWFEINPRNHSGRRLYRITDTAPGEIWVTNACPQSVGHARQHGQPSTIWLATCLHALPRHLRRVPLLVCGKVAQRTYEAAKWRHGGPVVLLPHPAARSWTKQQLRAVQHQLSTLR
jgi:hypothetical protein